MVAASPAPLSAGRREVPWRWVAEVAERLTARRVLGPGVAFGGLALIALDFEVPGPLAPTTP
ncbi:hypothetical protein [Nonomuraea jabiensis]|uniref:Uncharacterized protein n=1 Tax=Nonomuraea jabiensis TaxID=882448 RepID=A0A7W9LAB8_9ACTN|nr:hypothetical protein [Nonomuraea jabiensis]MBB5776456.1 hypothetical protein [Nonomuraea jabiensis]